MSAIRGHQTDGLFRKPEQSVRLLDFTPSTRHDGALGTYAMLGGSLPGPSVEQSHCRMDRGQVEVEHPTVPDWLVIVCLLRVVVMANAEVVGDVEQIAFIAPR
jgi:hypothetical protein